VSAVDVSSGCDEPEVGMRWQGLRGERRRESQAVG